VDSVYIMITCRKKEKKKHTERAHSADFTDKMKIIKNENYRNYIVYS